MFKHVQLAYYETSARTVLYPNHLLAGFLTWIIDSFVARLKSSSATNVFKRLNVSLRYALNLVRMQGALLHASKNSPITGTLFRAICIWSIQNTLNAM